MIQNGCRFGAFHIDFAARELRRGGELLTVSPKVFDCIAYLIGHRQRAVGRDELISAVWGRVDIADVQLGYLMRKVRRLLHDDGECQRVIRTIPRYGFRWVAELRFDAPDAASRDRPGPLRPAPAERATTTAGARRVRTRARLRMFAVWSVAASAIVVSLAFWREHAASDRHPAPPIAVLPATGDVAGDAEWMRFGLMDAIANRFRLAGAAVASSADIVMLSRGPPHGEAYPDRIRHALGARAVVLPTVVRDGSDWAVRLEIRSDEGPSRTVQEQAPDVLVAARSASDRMLELLGMASPPAQSSPPDPVAGLIQRSEAALLISDYGRARYWIETAPPALREQPIVQLQLGRIETATGHGDAASARLQRLLEAVSSEDDAVLRARALTALGIARLAQPGQAVAHLSEAVALLEDGDEPGHLGAAYNGRGIANRGLGRYDEAAMDLAGARAAYGLANDLLRLADVDTNEATLDMDRGRLADASLLLMRALERYEQIGAISRVLAARINLMSVHLSLVQPLDALEVFESARSRLDQVGNATDLYMWKIQGAAALAANGRLDEAAALLGEVLHAEGEAPDGWIRAVAHAFAAEVDFAAEDFEGAAAHARRALRTMPEPPRFLDELARARLTLIRSLREVRRNDEADAELARLTEWAAAQHKPRPRQYAQLADAERLASQGRHDAAARLYQAILDAAVESDTAAGIVEVATSFGNALIDGGDLRRAGVVVGRIGRWVEHDYRCALLSARLYRALGRQAAWRSALGASHRLAGERRIPVPVDDLPRFAVE